MVLTSCGHDRHPRESGAEPVHRDGTGVLWRAPLPGDEDVVTVEAVDSTPEPDGTSRTYRLRVPPEARTARQGVAVDVRAGGRGVRAPAGEMTGGRVRRD